MEGKKSFFEPICKARLKTGAEKKKKFFKSLSVLKEDCQAFGLLGNKAEKLAEGSNIQYISNCCNYRINTISV